MSQIYSDFISDDINPYSYTNYENDDSANYKEDAKFDKKKEPVLQPVIIHHYNGAEDEEHEEYEDSKESQQFIYTTITIILIFTSIVIFAAILKCQNPQMFKRFGLGPNRSRIPAASESEQSQPAKIQPARDQEEKTDGQVDLASY
jgi:hypothetical protein